MEKWINANPIALCLSFPVSHLSTYFYPFMRVLLLNIIKWVVEIYLYHQPPLVPHTKKHFFSFCIIHTIIISIIDDFLMGYIHEQSFFWRESGSIQKIEMLQKMCFHQKKIFNYNVTDVIIALKNMHIYHTLERKQTLDHQKTRFFPRFCPTIYGAESFKKISLFFFDYHDNLFPRKNNRVVC